MLRKSFALGLLLFSLFFPCGLSQAVLKTKSSMPEFAEGLKWINGEPIKSTAELKDRVTVIYFWNSSDYDSLNFLPFLSNLYLNYQESNVSVIAVHLPKYEFEKNSDSVAQALSYFRIYFPQALDTQGRFAAGFGVTDLPTLYFIDPKGMIHSSMHDPIISTEVLKRISDIFAQSGMKKLKPWPSGEVNFICSENLTQNMLLGVQDLAYLGNRQKVLANEIQSFEFPQMIDKNRIYFSGPWRFKSEYVEAMSRQSRIMVLTDKSALSVVAGNPVNETKSFKITLLGGMPIPKEIRGVDVSEGPQESTVRILEPRLYNLISMKSKPSVPLAVMIQPEVVPIFFYNLNLSDSQVRLQHKVAEAKEEGSEEGIILKTTMNPS